MKTCKKYRPEEISRFVDKELLPDPYREMEQHLVSCDDCRAHVRQYIVITDKFRSHVQKQKLEIDSGRLMVKYFKAREGLKKRYWKNIFGNFTKNIYLKLASITAILIISLFAFQRGGIQSAGPSAIVTSVDSDVASVMIIETLKNKHTIIWFSET